MTRHPTMKVEHLVTQAQAVQVCELLGLDPDRVLAITITAGGYEAEVRGQDTPPPHPRRTGAPAVTHQRRADRYVPPRYPVDEPPTWRATCLCGWAGPERYGAHYTNGVDLPELDYTEHRFLSD